VIFAKDVTSVIATAKKRNFTAPITVATLNGSWNVSFDPKWGGPKNIIFNELQDWALRPEDGIKYYSGLATYSKSFDMPGASGKLFIDLGLIKNLARVKLNGKDLGVVWTAPWRVEIPDGLTAKTKQAGD
jgi:hypothetical protein